MKKKLLATFALLGLVALPALADTQVLTFSKNGKTVVITITYTESGGAPGRIDTLRELRSISNIQVTIN